jgi:small-conductance mechanosensitive channel
MARPRAVLGLLSWTAALLAVLAATTAVAEPQPSARPPASPASAVPSTSAPAPAAPVIVPAPSAPAPPAPPAASEAPPPSTPATPGEATVHVHERVAFTLVAVCPGQSAAGRARVGSQVLEAAVDAKDEPEIRVEEPPDLAVLYAGKTPIITLCDADARAAGETNLHVYAASMAARAGDALRTERKRSAIATTVFSVSLVVFSALVAFLLARRLGDLARKGAAWVDEYPDRLGGLHVGTIEVIGAAAIRGAISVALGVGRLIALGGIAYTWLIIVLSLFDATRGYTERLTGFVLTPVGGLVSRAGTALPLIVVAAVAGLASAILVRFAGVFLRSVARGETRLAWLPPDLAAPTSVLVRGGIVVLSLVFAAPLITGGDDGALSRAGAVALIAVGLAATPLLACAAAGVPVVFGRRLRLGDFAVVGGHAGRILHLTLLEVSLEDPSGCEVRVPHLLGLFRPTRVIGRDPVETLDLLVDAREDQARVRAVLLAAARGACRAVTVEMLALDGEGARYRISGHVPLVPPARVPVVGVSASEAGRMSIPGGPSETGRASVASAFAPVEGGHGPRTMSGGRGGSTLGPPPEPPERAANLAGVIAEAITRNDIGLGRALRREGS